MLCSRTEGRTGEGRYAHRDRARFVSPPLLPSRGRRPNRQREAPLQMEALHPPALGRHPEERSDVLRAERGVITNGERDLLFALQRKGNEMAPGPGLEPGF